MSSIYRILITDFGALKKQIRKKEDGVLLPVIPRVGDIIVYFYQVHPEVDDTKEIDLKVTSVKILCQPGLDNFNIEPGQESKFWDEAFTFHAEIKVDEAVAEQ
ncbi:hypothetical protein [Acaryochloris marina]|uniref:hypothetical protein n=1 Tax=Acaryochloris marina TaxID=155978 RepID=UPI0021C4A6F2|nr:hypothetical protein [Acaryochloris marina]BDM83842.1 hypothetical protein AM10699_67030 [Acaryochloris marina MBIC10699]